MSAFYTAEDLVAATGGHIQGLSSGAVTGVSIDSRDMPEGGLYAAIKGVSLDGHDYVRAAFENGAAAAMVSEMRAGAFADLPILVVPDVLKGLEAIGRFARARSEAKIVAITGSAGKTTTKEATRLVLSGFGVTHASIRSFNNHWGVPLMLARLPDDADFGVFEIGMNHPGEIKPLSRMVRPHVAVITMVAEAHMQAFDSLTGVANAKAEIFEGFAPGGVAVLNADHDQLEHLRAAAKVAGASRIVTYGFSVEADVVITAQPSEDKGETAIVAFGDRQVVLRIAAEGRHMLANATAALAVADVLGLDLDKAAAQLVEFGAGEGRGTVIRLGAPGRDVTLIDESFNANPASMRAALSVFGRRRLPSGRKVLVLGDMLELGTHSPDLHAGLETAVLGAHADLIFLVGPEMRSLAERLGPERVTGWTQSVEEAEKQVLNALAFGDAVMIKGSKGIRLSSLVGRIRGVFGEVAAS